MQLVNIILSMGLIILILGITVLSTCTLMASTSGINILGHKAIGHLSLLNRREVDRRKQADYSFPFSCTNGTTIYLDRRSGLERRSEYIT